MIRMGGLCDEMFIVYKGLVALLGKILGPAKVLDEDMILCLQHAYVSHRAYLVVTLTS